MRTLHCNACRASSSKQRPYRTGPACLCVSAFKHQQSACSRRGTSKAFHPPSLPRQRSSGPWTHCHGHPNCSNRLLLPSLLQTVPLSLLSHSQVPASHLPSPSASLHPPHPPKRCHLQRRKQRSQVFAHQLTLLPVWLRVLELVVAQRMGGGAARGPLGRQLSQQHRARRTDGCCGNSEDAGKRGWG